MVSIIWRGIDKDWLGNRTYLRYTTQDVPYGYYVGATLFKGGHAIDFPAKQDWWGGDSSMEAGEISLWQDVSNSDSLVMGVWDGVPGAGGNRLADITIDGTSLGGVITPPPDDTGFNYWNLLPLGLVAVILGLGASVMRKVKRK